MDTSRKRRLLSQVEVRAVRVLAFAGWNISDISRAIGRSRKAVRRAAKPVTASKRRKSTDQLEWTL